MAGMGPINSVQFLSPFSSEENQFCIALIPDGCTMVIVLWTFDNCNKPASLFN